MEEREKLIAAGIDVPLTMQCLEIINSRTKKEETKEDFRLPDIQQHPSVTDLVGSKEYHFSAEQIKKAKQRFPILNELLTDSQNGCTIAKDKLKKVGESLFDSFAFGLFNGGSSSSYFDRQRNRKFSEKLFQLYKDDFEEWRSRYQHLPKGLTPAFANAQVSVPNYLELKLRSIFHFSQLMKQKNPSALRPIGFFQMTGEQTNDPIQEALAKIAQDPFFKAHFEQWSLTAEKLLYAVQPLLAAITHSQEGEPRRIFFDKLGQPLAMPGGHGQCFTTLKGVFQKLWQQGYRYVSLGNIDNLGYNPDPQILALLALSGAEAAFCGAYKTALDNKGGVILETADKRFVCRDLGVALEPQFIADAESRGQKILFNCAIGYFDLELLLQRLEQLIKELPLRVSDQDKERGRYAQMEQVTWESIAMFDKTLIVGVSKKRRFLAAKLVLENFINSGYRIESLEENGTWHALAKDLSEGVATILNEDCALNQQVLQEVADGL